MEVHDQRECEYDIGIIISGLNSSRIKMSSVSSINPGRANSNNTPVDQSLLKALHDFQEILDPGQKQRFLSQSSVPDASAAIILTAEIDNENAKRRSRCVAARILSFLESVQQFCSVVDTFVSSNPRIAALVWGSVKFVMLVRIQNSFLDPTVR